MRNALSAILLVATSTVAQADPSQYLCLAERSAALHYDKQAKTWAAQAFVPNDKFVLRRLSDDERKNWRSNAKWGFFGLGETWPTALCGTEFDLTCLWGAVEFEPGLSWRLYKDNPNNPGGVIIETGKCSAL